MLMALCVTKLKKSRGGLWKQLGNKRGVGGCTESREGVAILLKDVLMMCVVEKEERDNLRLMLIGEEN